MKSKRRGSICRGAAVGLVGLAAGIGILRSGLFDSADEMFPEEQRRSQKTSASGPVFRAELSSDVTRIPLPVELTRTDRLRQWIWHLPAFVRAAVLLPLWTVGRGALALLQVLIGALSPIAAVLMGFLGQALVLFALFVLLYRLLFPNGRLRDLFRKGRWLFLLGGALLLAAADRILLHALENWLWMRILLGAVVASVVLALVWNRLFRGHAAPALPEKWIEIPHVA